MVRRHTRQTHVEKSRIDGMFPDFLQMQIGECPVCPQLSSKVCLWCASQHRPKHFDEGAYTVVTDCNSDLRDRFPLCQHLKGSKQPRLPSPTAK